ncbi:hypothetical protein [Pseudomonas sp.]|uniref:hypothetical protein n=1 Tax=Pseudomonas sp. TaxID=306 RepID=UPI003FD78A2D
MLFWEWERLESYVENNLLKISDPGKLLAPVHSVKIWRNQNLQLVMETKSTQHPWRENQTHPPGTVRMNEDAVEFVSIFGDRACASGVDVAETKSNMNLRLGTNETTETCSLNYFETQTDQVGIVTYVFDWIANIDQSYYIWPDGVNDCTQETSTRTFGQHADAVTLSISIGNEIGCRNCVDLIVGGWRVVLGCTRLDADFNTVRPGYLLFFGDPDSETRERVRDSLSFALGFPIVHLGHAKYNEKQELLGFKAINAYTMDGKAFNVPAMAPAPICRPAENKMMDKIKLEKVTNSFFNNYHNYGLKSFNWVYWHAVTAPTHMAPAYFGAAIEAIQKKYIDNQGASFNNLIIAKNEYRLIKRAVLVAMKEFDLTPEDARTFINKLHNGNVVSLKVRSQRFFNYIDLDMGNAETIAWQRRNDAAHGNELVDGDYISLIRDTKILKLILNRIVLKITGASNEYTDYYSLNFPIKNIKSGVAE